VHMAEPITTGRGCFALDDRPHYVYEFWTDRECLYVGMTASPAGRIQTHARQYWWGRVTRIEANVYPNRAQAMAREAHLIDLHQPAFNWYHTAEAAGHRSGVPTGRRAWTKSDVVQ